MGCNCQATIDEIMLENNELSQKVGDQYKTIEMLKDVATIGCNCRAAIDEMMLENSELRKKVVDQHERIEMLQDILRERELELAALSKKH